MTWIKIVRQDKVVFETTLSEESSGIFKKKILLLIKARPLLITTELLTVT